MYYQQLGESLSDLLPAGIDALKRSDAYEEWQLFTKMLIGGHFPTDNITYKLFTDVLNFYSKSDTRCTRYSDET